jgi:hypothetical protein
MTKTEARKVAQGRLRYGYFDYGSELGIDCPNCRKHIRVSYSMWTVDNKGKRMSKPAQIREELIRHLTFEGECSCEKP